MNDLASGNIAAARAYLAAGNFKLAEQHIKAVLATNPSNNEACDAWCQLLRSRKKFAELEDFAKTWIGRSGRNIIAYSNLFISFVARKDRKNATAVFAQFRELFPNQIPFHAVMESALETNFGEDASSFDAVIKLSQASNDQKNLFRFQSQAAFRRSNFTEAVRLGDKAWQAGYKETSFASYMAMLCFRSFRFAKSRDYARLALLADPSHAVARELLVLTRLVWFPPFLLAHGFLLLCARYESKREIGVAVWGVFMPLTLFLITAPPALLPPSIQKATILSAVILMTIYSLYFPFIGQFAAFINRRRPPIVRLSDY